MRKLQRPYEQAENGAEAVQRYSAGPDSFALILMDLTMPVMDGFKATENIRSLEEKNGWERCQIVALTGLGSAEARKKATSCGVDTYLTKPVNLGKLKGIVGGLDG